MKISNMLDLNKRIGIIGVGNIFMGDDGAGSCVLKLLENESLPENVAVINEGARGISLLHILTKLDTAIIIDAVDFGGVPGEICCFTPEEVKSEKQISGLSTHECDLLDVIELSRKLGECPENIIVFGIQPSAVTSGELSPPLKTKLPELAEHILELVRQ